MLTPENPTPRQGLRFAIDNGAWGCKQRGEKFDSRAFLKLVDRCAGQADFVVIPDIVEGGMESLMFSISWIPKLSHVVKLLLPVQDGMEPFAVGNVLRNCRNMGIFLGGSTEWKLREMYPWGLVAATMGRHYHVGRVNTRRRIQLAAEAGAHSFDGTSVSRYSKSLPALEDSRRQPRLFTARDGHL